MMQDNALRAETLSHVVSLAVLETHVASRCDGSKDEVDRFSSDDLGGVPWKIRADDERQEDDSSGFQIVANF